MSRQVSPVVPDSLLAGRRRPPQEGARIIEDESLLTPVERTAVFAFQNVVRAANGDNERARERERELAEEKDRQRRLRDKLQGSRTNGRSGEDNIDGIFLHRSR